MSKRYRVCVALLSCVVRPLLLGAAPERGVIYGDDVYVNCEYRIAAHFPANRSSKTSPIATGHAVLPRGSSTTRRVRTASA